MLWVLGVFVLLLLVFCIYLYRVAQMDPPEIADRSADRLQRQEPSKGFYTLGENWFRHSNSGLYELYVEGKPYERGVVNGKLTAELVQRQEDHFAAQISKMIPSAFYRQFLKYFIGWFNRKLPGQVSEEYKDEIYGISGSASGDYGYIGKPYQRLLNYHAAHDIGHALQSMALVGCTSFATWNGHSADSNLIIGRNFDFWVGDKFAEDKIVGFFKPDQGYGFMTVTWGGFIGAVSGMNEKGLTVTINAAKTAIPSASATPVSLVAREILQYAGNIEQAIRIARSRKMFVSESFLVGSAADNKAVIIEKTPDSLDVYDPNSDHIICTNHFQGEGLAGSASNREQLQESASPYRYQRMEELVGGAAKNTVAQTVAILRDYRGKANTDIGLGNEKAVNQFIAHHSIVFEPKLRKVWVSTAPWQLGSFVCYDLNKVFALRGMKTDREIADSSLAIAPDSLLFSPQFSDFQRFRSYRQRILDGGSVSPDSLVASNPTYYHAWVLAGNESKKKGDCTAAVKYFQKALTMEMATLGERKAVEEALRDCSKQ